MQGLAEMRAAGLPVLLLERAHAENKMGIAVVAIELHKPLGKPHRLIDLAIGQQRLERQLQQFRIALVGLERSPIVGRRVGVTVQIGLARRKVTAGRRLAAHIARAWGLRTRGLRRNGLRNCPKGRGCDRGEGSVQKYFHGSLLSNG